jgi:hypothetical protein
MCNVPEGTVTAEAAGSSPSRKSLTIDSFHEKAGECQDFSFIFSLFFSFCLPPLSPPFHPHSLLSDCRSVQGGVYLTQ